MLSHHRVSMRVMVTICNYDSLVLGLPWLTLIPKLALNPHESNALQCLRGGTAAAISISNTSSCVSSKNEAYKLLYIHMYMYTYVHTYINAYINIEIEKIYTYIYTHIHIYTHIRNHFGSSSANAATWGFGLQSQYLSRHV